MASRPYVGVLRSVQRVSIETPDYAAMMVRMVRAYGVRVGEADPEDLAVMLELHEHLDAAIRVAVAGQRETGFSWAEIAAGLGVKRQTAWARFSGDRESPVTLVDPDRLGSADGSAV